MRGIFKRRPSGSMAVAFVALLAALSGTAAALPGHNTVRSDDIVNGQVKTQDIRNGTVRGKDIRNGTVKGADVGNDSLTGDDVNESTLGTVPNASHASDADTVGGRSAASLDTASGFDQNLTVISSLGTAFVNLASASITTSRTGGVVAQASAELFGANADERAQCHIIIDGVSSLYYETTFDDIGTDNEATVPVTFARTLAAGNHTATLQCRALAGTVGKDDAAISVVGVG